MDTAYPIKKFLKMEIARSVPIILRPKETVRSVDLTNAVVETSSINQEIVQVVQNSLDQS